MEFKKSKTRSENVEFPRFTGVVVEHIQKLSRILYSVWNNLYVHHISQYPKKAVPVFSHLMVRLKAVNMVKQVA